MAKYYFVRKATLTLSGDQQIHLLSLATGVSFKARLDQPLTSKSVFPGMTYQASITKRGRGLIVTSLVPADDVGFLECKALANFVGTHNALPRYAPPSSLGKLLEDAASQEQCPVRQLLDHRSRYMLGKHLGEAQAAQLQFVWEEYLAFQASVTSVMAQGFCQISAEKMVKYLPEDADLHLLSTPLLALPFLETGECLLARHPGFNSVPELKPAMALLRYLERQSLAGNTLVEVSDALAGEGTVIGDVSRVSEDVIKTIHLCETHGWIVSTEGWVQLASNYHLQSAVRDHLTKICQPFHPSYSRREIDHAFNRLSAFTPDMFTYDMIDEVALAINSRVLFVRHDDIRAAMEFTQQYCAVYELLSNVVPTSLTVAKARCAAYENKLDRPHTPFYEITDGAHTQAIVVHQFNQLPLFEIFQLISSLGNVMSLIALIDTTLPTNAAIEQMSRYFSTIDIQVPQQGALPIQRCLQQIGEMETRIEMEDLQRIAVICDCPKISLHLNRRYSSVPADTKVPKKGDLIRLSPRGLRCEDDALMRIVNVKQNELFVSQSLTYRTIKAEEFSRRSWNAGFALSPNEAVGVALPPVLVFTSAKFCLSESGAGSALVRNLQAQGVRVIEHCVYEIEGSPKHGNPGTLQRIVPLVE
ncbi:MULTISPECIES: hypothetical protein [unclassified Pseudomonas]|uniref:hypothetical protein n=1 Tax=unclassified Pseudomonas TaxID=196821 RepID=UPI000CD0774F|nr:MULTISPECIES: hypothetical protein [unclassified Pseudomonas]POA28176.1 hypothetical protein C1887_24805 [Pseudomonas sp. GW456-R21]POA62135.1 hypothetical protein C1884_27500 [Pseudomonas sp. GW460-R15]